MSSWYALMFTTGFCSMLYELALAQLLGSVTGNVLARFATTLGVYVFGLGVGSLLFKSSDDRKEGRQFYIAEIGLVFCGLASPFIIVGVHRFAFAALDDANSRALLVLLIAHLLVFLTGLFSGFELPALASLAGRRGVRAEASVLSYDYLGMFAASVFFPLVAFPVLGLMASIWLATFLNLGAAIATTRLLPVSYSRVALVLLFMATVTSLLFSSILQEWLGLIYAATA